MGISQWFGVAPSSSGSSLSRKDKDMRKLILALALLALSAVFTGCASNENEAVTDDFLTDHAKHPCINTEEFEEWQEEE